MKRHTELARGAPLVTNKGLARGKGLGRTASKPREASQPRSEPRKAPSGRTGVPTTTRELVRARSGSMCELRLPDVCLGPGHNLHHRLPRRMGGTRNPSIHNASNLLSVCGTGNSSGCHGFAESNRTQAIACGWLIPSGGNPATTPVLLLGRWQLLLEDGTTSEVVSP